MEADISFEEFVAARWAALYRFAYLLVGDHFRAEDLLQDVLARTWVRWHAIKNKGAVEAYVRRGLVNQATRTWRRRNRETLVEQTPDAGRSAEIDTHADQQVLWNEVRLLPPKMRAALVLRYFEDMSERETAAALGVSVGAIKSQTHHALKRLRIAMTEVETLL